jgi:exonuclease III
MAGHQNSNAKQRAGSGKLKKQLSCIQINLQHSRLATDNLLKLIKEDDTDIICIQEPYVIGNKIVGLPQYYTVFASGEGRKRAAIVINNRQIDTLLINQLSDEDAVVLETKVDNTRIIIASLYFDISRPLDTDMQKIEATLAHAKGAGVIIAMDSNSRSTSWHDVITNRRGKILEEFLMSKQLHIINEESCYTTFRSSRGASNIDLTVTNNQALDIVREWVISDQESCSDHSILKYVLGNGMSRWTGVNTEGVRYKVTKKDSEKFQVNLQLMEQRFCGSNSEVGETEELDETLRLRVAKAPNMETIVEEHDVLASACSSSFKILRTTKKASTHKSVPWWTEGLTILRKRVNAQRRQYQRTRTTGSAEITVPSYQSRVRRHHQERKKRIVEGVLQYGFGNQSLG